MRKQPGWERLLADWARTHLTAPTRAAGLVWGTNDCWSLVRGAVEAMTGEPWTPAIESLADAVRLMRAEREEHGTLDAALVSRGCIPAEMKFAASGDVVLLEADDPDALPWMGVVVGTIVVASNHRTGPYRGGLTDAPPGTLAYVVP